MKKCWQIRNVKILMVRVTRAHYQVIIGIRVLWLLYEITKSSMEVYKEYILWHKSSVFLNNEDESYKDFI